MDPLTLIVSALAFGAAAASKDVANQAVRDAYNGLKTLIIRKFGETSKVESAIDLLEDDPKSEDEQKSVAKQVQKAKADQDQEVVEQAKKLVEMLNKQGMIDQASLSAILTGSGAIAQGGSVAAGERGVATMGDLKGPINTGEGSIIGDVGGSVYFGDTIIEDEDD